MGLWNKRIRVRLSSKVGGSTWARLLENDTDIESSECIIVVYRGIQRHDAEISSLRAKTNLSSKEKAEKKLATELGPGPHIQLYCWVMLERVNINLSALGVHMWHLEF